jgi:E3 ubiquitin-protein ligase RNF14
VFTALPAPIPTILKQGVSTAGSSGVLPTLEIAHLPPITVRLLLPPSYPLQQPPKVLSLRANLPDGDLRHHWLEKASLARLEDRVREFWEEEKAVVGEGAGVIWRWWEWIGAGEFLTDLGYIADGQLRYVLMWSYAVKRSCSS